MILLHSSISVICSNFNKQNQLLEIVEPFEKGSFEVGLAAIFVIFEEQL